MGIEDKTLLMRYLLGDLPEPDRERLEEQYFVSDDSWEALRAAEHDLIDAYVRGELSQRQREQFESYFLTSSRNRQHLELASLLLSGDLRKRVSSGAIGDEKKNRVAETFLFWKKDWHPALKLTVAAAAVAAIAIALFLAVQNRHLKEQFSAWNRPTGSNNQPASITPTPPPETGSHPEETTAQLAPPDSSTLAVLLTPGMVRGEGNSIRKVVLSDAVQTVVLQLALEESEYSRYEAVVQSAEGKEVARLVGLRSKTTKANGPLVPVKLPARNLVKGDYIVRLSARTDQGMQDVDSYTFSVIR